MPPGGQRYSPEKAPGSELNPRLLPGPSSAAVGSPEPGAGTRGGQGRGPVV